MSATEPLPVDHSEPASWRPATRFAFRFALVYLLLYNFPFPCGFIPGTEPIGKWLDNFWYRLAPPVAHLLHIPLVRTEETGSGDTSLAYVELFYYVLIALVAAAIWSRWARRREYTRLHELLRVFVRYVLAWTLLSYGVTKLFRGQFPPLSPTQLTETYGESSPMGLLWRFMGASGAYTIFTGACEVLGGLLLFFRRTTMLGALVLVPVMGNVVMLNLCYDVPVKLYSMNLLLMAVFLLVPDLRRLADVLLFNRATAPVAPPPAPSIRWKWRALIALQCVFIAGGIGFSLVSEVFNHPKRTEHPLSGAYAVEGASTPMTWRAVTIGYFVAVRLDDGTQQWWQIAPEPRPGVLALARRDSESAELSWKKPDADHLLLDGKAGKDEVHLRLRRLPPFLLTTRGFHWVQEYPFNR